MTRMHTLHLETTFDDGHTTAWDYDQPGPAAEAHAALAARWKAAGAVFDQDKAGLRLTRHYPDADRGGPYTDVITHVDWAEEVAGGE